MSRALAYARYVTLRVPYRMSSRARGLDGRIDGPSAGRKGGGLWSTDGDRVPRQLEGGKGTKPHVVHIETRPDPLGH